MGLSRMSAMMIQGNDDVRVATAKSKREDKFMFVVQLWKNGDYHTDIVSTEPVYASREIAQRKGEGFVKEIKEMDLSWGQD